MGDAANGDLGMCVRTGRGSRELFVQNKPVLDKKMPLSYNVDEERRSRCFLEF